MTLPAAYSSISISQIRDELNITGMGGGNAGWGTALQSMSNMYKGGTYIKEGIYEPNGIPTSGAISLHDFHSASAWQHYYTSADNYVYWQASVGWSVDYQYGGLLVTLGTQSTLYHQQAYGSTLGLGATNASVAAGGWSQVARVYLAAPNTIYYGTNDTLIKPGGVFYEGQTINAYSPSGWCMAASYNGANSMTIYCQPTMNSTGDTGSSITLNNLIAAFGQISGSYTYVSGYDADSGAAIYSTVYNTSYTYNFR